MFDTGDGIEAFPESEVVGLFLSAGVATAHTQRENAPAMVTVPAGTLLETNLSAPLSLPRP